MKTLLRSDIPWDFAYYRTGSKVFYDYYRQHSRLLLHRIDEGYTFLRAGHVFGNTYSVIAEKIDIEPTPELLRSIGIHHGIVFWWPMRVMNRPKWWIPIPKFIVQYLELFHSSRSAFSLLDTPDYWKKWSSSARAHRRKVLELQSSGRLTIELINDLSQYLEIYKKTKVPDPHKRFLTQWCEKNFPISKDRLRVYIASMDGVPLAWAVFIDIGVTSEYFTSFYAKESHPYHLGIALMDRWFLDSYQKWIKYCDLDHIRDSWQSQSYAGYTKFKESLADHDVYFHDMWVKLF